MKFALMRLKILKEISIRPKVWRLLILQSKIAILDMRWISSLNLVLSNKAHLITRLNMVSIFRIVLTLFFLTGHIFFITACSKIKSLDKYDFIFPIVIILLFPFFIKKKRLTIGKLKPFVYIYAFFISFLFSKCVLMFWNTGTRQTALLAIGSLLFLISDTLILFLYFPRQQKEKQKKWEKPKEKNLNRAWIIG